jgi:uncharacterized membrane protein YczE
MTKLIIRLIPLLYSANLFAHGISEEAKQTMMEGSFLQYIWLGAEHMITGYDHLLFLFGVIFFLTTFREIVKFISIFTLGHSITLIFATFMGVSANFWLIDAVIALSVCYKGFDNNNRFQDYLGMKKSPNLMWMVFIFGLIHGFGLSTRLQQLPLGEKGISMLMRIISFNVGVELGQIAGLVLMLIIMVKIRKLELFKRLSRILNDGLILAGFMLFLMQIHGYQHSVNPDEFGFSEDNHIHHHLDLESQNNEKQHDSL